MDIQRTSAEDEGFIQDISQLPLQVQHEDFRKDALEVEQVELNYMNIQTNQAEVDINKPCTSQYVYEATAKKVKHLSSRPKTQLARATGSHQRKNVLTEVNVTRQAELSPKARHIYRKVLTWGNRMASLQRRIKSYRVGLNHAEKTANSQNFEQLLQHVT